MSAGSNRIVLMNSAMMPQPGSYQLRKIDIAEFVNTVQNAVEIYSSIGYDSVANIITNLTGISVNVNRDLTVLKDGDELLVMKLKYRIDPSKKGVANPPLDDYEFLNIKFHA